MTEKDLRAILGINLRRYRNHRKITQMEFAEEIDISIPFLSEIENGKKWVSPKTLVKMADQLGIEVYELLKPEKSLSDNAENIIDKYSEGMYSAFRKTLEDFCSDYISNLGNK